MGWLACPPEMDIGSRRLLTAAKAGLWAVLLFCAVATPALAQTSTPPAAPVAKVPPPGAKKNPDKMIVEANELVFDKDKNTVSAVGEIFPLHCTANGKAYLAQLSDPAIEALIGRAYEARTNKTLTRIDALLAELKSARRSGIAYDREEHTLGICAVGVALQDPLGNSVAISVPVPSQRFPDRHALIAERLMATKRALETHMNSAAA